MNADFPPEWEHHLTCAVLDPDPAQGELYGCTCPRGWPIRVEPLQHMSDPHILQSGPTVSDTLPTVRDGEHETDSRRSAKPASDDVELSRP